MNDLRRQLDTALGDRYRIDRELGGGGMSRVFVAEEIRLGRQVVIKVLPPAASAGIDAGRFEREIQVAASLHHPHIVQLLAAGESDGLLWFAMPFVAGESLAERLTRGPLEVHESMRILREIADALAYAHERGIVHRDIKPANILLSGRHALVADFGVAKALARGSEDHDAGTLTSVGMALGTPAYMAPEQAVADPSVDFRADIYALGVVGYEMLTGKLPYRASTAQAMLAAHVTQPAGAITTHRADIPAPVASLIMRALAKSPTDRWDTTTAFVDAIENVATPSGGSPPIAASAARRYQVWHPARVAALYVPASLVLVAAAFGITRAAALPDWIWWATAAVLVVGLPIMLIAGRRERHDAWKTMTGAMPAVDRRGLTGRRALIGGFAAVAAVVAVAAAFSASRVFGIGPAATLVSRGGMGEGDQLILAEFANTSRDTSLTGAVVEALRVDLSQSRTVRLVPATQISSAMSRAGMPDSARLTPSRARELAERIGAKAVLSGDIRSIGTGYVLAARLESVSDTSAVEQIRETATNDGELIAAVNKLSKKLRERIGESLKSLRAAPTLDQVTTTSLPALRLYSAASREIDIGRYDTARELLERAVAVDSTFAMAWRRLAVVYSNLGANLAREQEAATRAYRFRSHLPQLEQSLAEGYYYTRVIDSLDRAAAAYRAALQVDPDNRIALNNLALALNAAGKYDQAEPPLRRALALQNPTYSAFVNLVESLGGQLKWSAADSVPDMWIRSGGDTLRALQLRLNTAGEKRDITLADSVLRAMSERKHDDINPTTLPYARYVTHGYHGQVRASEAAFGALRDVAARTGDKGVVLYDVLVTLMDEAVIRGRAEQAWQRVPEVLKRFPLDSISAPDRPYDVIAALAALAGKPGEVARYRAAAERAVPPSARRPGSTLQWDALTAVAARDWLRAAEHYGKLADATHCGSCGIFSAAMGLERAGRPDSALAMYLKGVAAPVLTGASDEDRMLYPIALERIAMLHDRLGQSAAALEYYGKFVELWKDADADLQPRVRTAKQRMAELTAEK